MSHGDQNKWQMPGWRIEQRYSTGVLIGNWLEDRHVFQRGLHKHNSTHRNDFKSYTDFKPDVTIRRKNLLQGDGLGKEFIFTHHGKKYSNNMISSYDEDYNKRERESWDRLPELRTWDSNRLAWVPEKSDHPMQGKPTTFACFDNLKKSWADSRQGNSGNGRAADLNTTYRVSYVRHPSTALNPHHYAVPKERSTMVHPLNSTNKDLDLRRKLPTQAPEDTQHLTAVMC
ncbi:cilia- and flagella-associated protein 107-like [Tubulanus polymorphus]|uniref:cilia- and flagella-associated protein 107-like n=1 Tax=Tubulanus polymorphus TaxID=672921 RepID=UPI003DA4431E